MSQSWASSLTERLARRVAWIDAAVPRKSGLPRAIQEAVWQRCHAAFFKERARSRGASRKVDDDCLRELRWFYDRRELAEVRRDIAAWLAEMAGEISQALRLGRGEHRGDALLLPAAASPSQAYEIDEHVLGAAEPGDQAANPCGAHLPRAGRAACGLARARAVEMHENWLEAMRYLNMDHLAEHKKQMLRQAA